MGSAEDREKLAKSSLKKICCSCELKLEKNLPAMQFPCLLLIIGSSNIFGINITICALNMYNVLYALNVVIISKDLCLE